MQTRLTSKLKDMIVLVSKNDAEIANLKVALLKANVKGLNATEILRDENDALKARVQVLDAKVEDMTQQILKKLHAV